MNPKVFVSHASEDKDRFVIPFSKKLREKGIDAWVDNWEILPGDSLVDKIFDDGIKNAEAFIIVLSEISVKKPWVREELNASFIKRIEKRCKIIPILIDACEVPECLKSTLWERIKSLEDYSESLEKIIRAIFEHREKPVLGEPPKFVKTKIDVLPGITKTDTIILFEACKLALEKNDSGLDSVSVFDRIKPFEVPENDFWESLEILDSKRFIKADRVMGGAIPFFFLTTYGVDVYCRSQIKDYDLIISEVGFAILNKELLGNFAIAEEIKHPVFLVDHILDLFENKGWVKLAKAMGGQTHIMVNSPELKRVFQKR
jgi:hypothetical protein